MRRRDFLRTTAVGAVTAGGIAAPTTAQETTTIGMYTEGGEYRFDPIGLHVEPGTTVIFENVSGNHNAVSYDDRIPEAADGFETAIGETTEVTFEEPGTYDYYCAPHKAFGMVGRVVVGEPGGPAEGSMPPDGDVPASSDIVDQGSIGNEAFASGGGGGGGNTENLLKGAGLFGGVSVLALLVYYLGNTEGERHRVGSAEWREEGGLE
jgi:pseudoazurin